MTLENTRKVRREDTRSDPGKCGYCKSKLGEEHEHGCVCFRKLVVARMSFDVLLAIPHYMKTEDAEFFWNDSSSCSDNRLDDLEKQVKHVVTQAALMGCCCPFAETKFLREATEEDHKHFSGGEYDVN
jgi:hypothetical protein